MTGSLDANGNEIVLDSDGDTSITSDTDDQIDFKTGGSDRADLNDSGLRLGGSGARVTTIHDEDDMVSDSATALATQQSIKAYADLFAKLSANNTFSGAIQKISANAKITLQLEGLNANAAGETVFEFIGMGKDSAGVKTRYGLIEVKVVDPTDTSEDGEIVLSAPVGGNSAERMAVGDGVTVGSPTGGKQGDGTINATGVYEDGTQIRSQQPSFSVHRNGTNQTGIVTATWTKIEFTTEEFDTNNDFDSASNYRYTPTVSGKYLLTANVRWTTAADGDNLNIEIRKNGNSYKASQQTANGTGGQTGGSLAVVAHANGTTDYFEVFVQQNSGSDKIIDGDSADTWFTGIRIGA